MKAIVKPGLYRHWKGNLYRVLFLARYSHSRSLNPDEEALIYGASYLGGTPSEPLYCLPSLGFRYEHATPFLTVRNSTNGLTPKDSTLVVYVALYGDGRVSVREINEFAGEAQPGVRRFTRVDEPAPSSQPPATPRTCRACAFCGIEPDSPYFICGYPDPRHPWGLYIKKEPLDHCPNFSKFEQHPGRNPDGTLKSG